MTPREPAERQLERVLHALAVAAREGGASLAELAAELGVAPERLLRDLEEVTARAYYLEPPVDIDIGIEEGRVEVWTTGEFRRPVKLSPREALALTLGLRLLAEESAAERAAALRALAARLDAGLAAVSAAALAEDFALGAGDPAGEGQLAALREAARERRPVELRYLKPADVEPETRALHPYALVHSGGRWYAIGHCPEAAPAGGRAPAIRAFRLDRILAVTPLGGSFEVPSDFDVQDYVATGPAGIPRGSLFRAQETLEVTVRYLPRIARWIEEQVLGVLQPDGSILVRHVVADPGWLVRHVLYHGADAEVVEPPGIRDLMRQRIEQIRISQEEKEWSEAAS
ncbi:MAG TPA: WYL domain-containing protein [Gemmatimonadota bacterium]